MSRSSRTTAVGSLGAFLLVLGMCSICGGAIQGFGDRMPNPPPEIQAQFEQANRNINLLFTCGLVFGFSGAICVAIAVTRSQKRD